MKKEKYKISYVSNESMWQETKTIEVKTKDVNASLKQITKSFKKFAKQNNLVDPMITEITFVG